MILIYGGLLAEPETFEELHREGVAHSRRSRAEDGCIHHALHVDAENPMRLFFFEKWRDRAAVDAHFKQPGSLAFMRVARRLNRGDEKMEIREV